MRFHGKPWPFVIGTDLISLLEIENVSCLKETKAELEKGIKGEVARPRLRKGETDIIFQGFRVRLEFPGKRESKKKYVILLQESVFL